MPPTQSSPTAPMKMLLYFVFNPPKVLLFYPEFEFLFLSENFLNVRKIDEGGLS